jgi:hypothetical protein
MEDALFDQLFGEMQAEDAVGLLVAVQLTESPNDVQFVVRSTVFDKSTGGLRDQNQYLIKSVGMVEHQVSLGMFDHIAFIDEHPLLYHYNTPPVRVFVGSRAESPDAIMHEIELTHTEVYDTWRDLSMDLNPLCPPEQLFSAGYGLLGMMPQPFAQAVAQVLARHHVKCNLVTDEQPPTQMKLLAVDESYFVAADFAIELIGP